MSTRPLAGPPFVPDDPGPWSGVLEVLQRRGGLPGRRRAEPPNGLMINPPPRTALAQVGLQADVDVAGVGPVRVVAAGRQPAVALEQSGQDVAGVSRMVRRTWSVPQLALVAEERPEADPAAAVPSPVFIDDLASGDLPADARLSADGAYAVVPVVEPPRYQGLAVVRVSDRALMRYIRFARCGVWAADGTLVVGGEWGTLALAHHREPPADDQA
ncbi:MAG: hypothetical protein U0Y82_04955 [Thermoleophilia bacterium]